MYTKKNCLLFFVFFILWGIGLATLNSSLDFDNQKLFYKQCFYVFIGLVLIHCILHMPYSVFYSFSYIAYIISLILLLYVEFNGVLINGSQRWISIFSVQFQPSEVAKVAVVLCLARFLSDNKNKSSFFLIFTSLVIISLPFFLIWNQPDLGTSIIFFLIGISCIYWSRISFKCLIFIFCALVVVLVPILLVSLKEYQVKRILGFIDGIFDISIDTNLRYHSYQAEIAIGSGGLLGRGFKKGSQNTLGFVSENETDFIFTVLAEEFGFFGCMFVLFLYVFYIIRFTSLYYPCYSLYGRITGLGLITYVFLSVVVNIFMELSMFPVIGTVLPFFSYGGTSAIVNCLVFGMLIRGIREFDLK